ncbi:MAG: putative bifunctional diguanylate cyclase/phosphodiesterase [Gammaproteobacteria bacterium]
MSISNNAISKNVELLRSRATNSAYQGVLIALAGIVIATSLLCFYQYGAITPDGIIRIHKSNFALWVLDCMPFVFALWGQISGSAIAYEASMMILDQTQDLRLKAEILEQQANYAATHDALTDLPNRVLFYDRAERIIVATDQSDRELSIILMEIANFPEIQETLGRNSSDALLRQVATRLKNIVKEADSAARLDGAVFSILLAHVTGRYKAELTVKQIQKALEPAFVVDNLKLTVNPNFGIVHYPEHGEDVDTLVQRAGVALFIANKSHHGFAVYDPSFDKSSPFRLTLMNELRQALAKDQLALLYQPKVTIESDKLYGVEALVRWNHPVHGFISPDDFIPMAERTRMIKPLTLWVLKRAFSDCAAWHESGFEMKVAINLSAKDLHDPEFPDAVTGVLAQTNISPAWIILEITESSIISDPEGVMETLDRLHDMGFQLSIDDFGTGYSSLAYLKRMPLSELKIDRSFVMDLLNNDSDAAIVKATINLAHNLGLLVTAEGVENQAIYRRLKEYGCDIAQGYYFSKPLAVADFDRWSAHTELLNRTGPTTI